MDKIKPIKRLGQNFLRDENILQRIADAAHLSGEDTVLEIGAGSGNLTRHLAEKAGFVYAVEKDRRLCKAAEENLKGFKNVEIICGDILKIDVGAGLKPAPTKVVGNLPYYITTPIIFKLLEHKENISDIIIMVQKEVAERIVAKPGGKDYGILTCSVQFYTEPKVLFKISKGSFYPRPKVDSVLLEMKILKKPAVNVKDEQKFFEIIKAAFGQRRKTLLNSLCNRLHLEKEAVEDILRKAGIEPQRRAETLDLDEFAKISNFLL